MVNDEALLENLEQAQEIVITDHALDRGYDAKTVREVVETLEGRIYIDRDNQSYHLVCDAFIAVLRVRDGKKVVITVYPGEEEPRYQTDRFRLLRG